MVDKTRIFHGEPQKIRIVSNNMGFGLPPQPDKEVEQHLTINADGRVYFSGYNFGNGHSKQKLRRRIFKIKHVAAKRILYIIAQYFSQEYIPDFAMDMGDWSLNITNLQGMEYKYCGSLMPHYEIHGINLSQMVRRILGMEDLFVFDGTVRFDKIERIAVEYHRERKIKPNNIPETVNWQYEVWHYREKLLIERESGIMEYVKIFDEKNIASSKYSLKDSVERILDSIDEEVLFGEVEGNPDGVIENPLENMDYMITVDFQKCPQRIISGTYDKRGLPIYWADFIQDILEFISAIESMGEMLDSRLYGRPKPRRGDYIYCSVQFDEGEKSYHYISDSYDIGLGDYVLVPAGYDNHQVIAKVVDIGYYTAENVPFPLDRTKHIIRKCIETGKF